MKKYLLESTINNEQFTPQQQQQQQQQQQKQEPQKAQEREKVSH